MPDEQSEKEVRFDLYCETCVNREVKEFEEPCNECLDNFYNKNSAKPINYKSRRINDE